MIQVDGWLSVKQAAAELGLSVGAVYYYILSGRLIDYRIGELRVISRADLDAYQASRVGKGRPGPRPAPPPDQGERDGG